MSIQKKSLISNRTAVKKALVATTVAQPTTIASPNKMVQTPSRIAPSRIAPSRIAPSRIAPSRIAPSRIAPTKIV
jgi:hypothetical protein